MLLNTERETVQTSGLGQGGNFTIAASAKAFEVLSSNLYQNKILAVIREITCNAADAHKMVGRPLSEIFIHLPTFSEPYFAVRDYGPGLSKDDVLSLYTTYFRSTKDDSNDLIGGFGLGSKSPFAVADQFTVTSWHGGMKRNYACFKDNGVPQVNLISEAPSQKPTGLEVRVATKDSNQWHREATNFFQWWSVLPRFNAGFTVTPLLHKDNIISASADKDDNGYPDWAIVRGLTGPTVFMGLVPYSLNISAIPDFDPGMVNAFAQLTIFLRFDVGALSISPSRETLSYDKSTATLLRSKLALIAKEITQKTQDQLAACKTMLEAREYAFNKLPIINHFGNVLLNMVKSGKLLWNGKRILGGVDIDLHKDFGPLPEDQVTFSSLEKRSYTKSWRKQHIDATSFRHNVNHYGSESVDRYWLPQISSKTYRTIAHYYENINKSTGWMTVQLFTGSTLDKINEVFTEKGIPTIKNFADLPEPPKAVRAKAATKVTKGYKITQQMGWERTEEELDLSDGGFYFEFFDGSPKPYSDKDIALYCRAAGWIKPDVNFLGFRRSALATKTMTAQLTANKWVRFAGKDWLHNNVTPQQVYDKALSDIVVVAHLTLLPCHRMLVEAHKAGITFKNPLDQALAVYAAGVNDSCPIFYMSGGTVCSPLNIYMSAAQQAMIPEVVADAAAKSKEYLSFNERHPLIPYIDINRMTDKSNLYTYINR